MTSGAPSARACARVVRVMVPPLGVASTALAMRLMKTCSRRAGSPKVGGTAGAGCSLTNSPASSMRPAVARTAARITALMSKGTVWRSAGRTERRRSRRRASSRSTSPMMLLRLRPLCGDASHWPQSSRATCAEARMLASGFRIPWATAATTSPIAAMRSAPTSCCCTERSSSLAAASSRVWLSSARRWLSIRLADEPGLVGPHDAHLRVVDLHPDDLRHDHRALVERQEARLGLRGLGGFKVACPQSLDGFRSDEIRGRAPLPIQEVVLQRVRDHGAERHGDEADDDQTQHRELPRQGGVPLPAEEPPDRAHVFPHWTVNQSNPGARPRGSGSPNDGAGIACELGRLTVLLTASSAAVGHAGTNVGHLPLVISPRGLSTRRERARARRRSRRQRPCRDTTRRIPSGGPRRRRRLPQARPRPGSGSPWEW